MQNSQHSGYKMLTPFAFRLVPYKLCFYYAILSHTGCKLSWEHFLHYRLNKLIFCPVLLVLATLRKMKSDPTVCEVPTIRSLGHTKKGKIIVHFSLVKPC